MSTDAELWSTSQVRDFLRLRSADAARVQLRRWGIPAAKDGQGHMLTDAVTGEKLWPAGDVRQRQEGRPRPNYQREHPGKGGRPAMAWNFMQVELVPQDGLVRPMIGPGGMTRDQAHAEVQSILDRLPALAPIAAAWRRGAKDDTVYAGAFTWAIYEYPGGEDPHRAVLLWLEDYAATMRGAGMDVRVARLPD